MTTLAKFLTLALLLVTLGCDDPKSADGKDDEIEMCPEVDPNPCDADLDVVCVDPAGSKYGLGGACQIDEECESGLCLKPWGYCSRECANALDPCSGGEGADLGITYSCEEVLDRKLCILKSPDPTSW